MKCGRCKRYKPTKPATLPHEEKYGELCYACQVATDQEHGG